MTTITHTRAGTVVLSWRCPSDKAFNVLCAVASKYHAENDGDPLGWGYDGQAATIEYDDEGGALDMHERIVAEVEALIAQNPMTREEAEALFTRRLNAAEPHDPGGALAGTPAARWLPAYMLLENAWQALSDEGATDLCDALEGVMTRLWLERMTGGRDVR